MKNSLLILATVLIIFSCKKMENIKINTVENTIFKDSVLSILPKNSSNSQQNITVELATATLNSHFKSKGFLIQAEIEKDLDIPRLPKNKSKNVIEFIDLKLFSNQLGVISYYNAPVGAIGHCVQPHNALISISEKGLILSNEEFLSPNFTIDSLKMEDNKPIIYSRDYNCYTKEFLKKYKIQLK